MIKRLKDNISLTLVEVLIAMLILSSSTAGVLGSFSYAYKFIRRAGHKIEALNYARKTQEALRAIWLYDASNGLSDIRLNVPTPWTDVADRFLGVLYDAYFDGAVYQPYTGGIIQYEITPGSIANSNQISVKIVWEAP